jgi:hypothetical protein
MGGWHEFYDEEDPAILDLARSVCAVCKGPAPNDGDEVLGTGFLIEQETVATALHVFRNVDVADSVYCVFGYCKLAKDQEDFPDLKYYTARLLKDGGSDRECSKDWACLVFVEPPPDLPPLELNPEEASAERMFVIGHPGRGPAKISAVCPSRPDTDDCFVLDLESQEGASGGPAFDSENKKVEGMLREMVDESERSRCLKARLIDC